MPRELDDDTSPPLLPWGDVEASMVQEGVIPCSCDCGACAGPAGPGPGGTMGFLRFGRRFRQGSEGLARRPQPWIGSRRGAVVFFGRRKPGAILSQS
jgi:hypothetical protein